MYCLKIQTGNGVHVTSVHAPLSAPGHKGAWEVAGPSYVATCTGPNGGREEQKLIDNK